MKNKFMAVDFFSGAGGMSCGFSQAGVKILAGIDIDNQFKQTYLANHKGAKFINKDIIRYQPEDLQEELNLAKFDDELIFIGCSPCQYWSKINTTKHKAAYTNNLIWDFQRFIKYFMPGYIVVENVPGIINKKNNHILLDFLDFLTFQGYRSEHRIVRTDHYGVPQKRNRFVLIASRVKDKIVFPEPEITNKLNVRNYIGPDQGFAKIDAGHLDKSDYAHSTSSLSALNLERIRSTPKNGGTREAWSQNPRLQIPAYMGKDNIFRTIYGRMSWDKPAPTITTRFIAVSCGRFGHPEEDRGLSLREGATLQTFPKDYKFIGGLVSIAKQIGNAVPPEMAKRIAESIIKN
ncbi:DNA cytosine methyltransferase [Lunatibacter salilacus]|uniref:DNA cytosine methyltransferase n=1 Tax=Lunatibacter salilacus TaxID=2483804 RepID=UPI00131B84D4|nr:DNA cytosine methyltransferase [Lunatibacter salilacus]